MSLLRALTVVALAVAVLTATAAAQRGGSVPAARIDVLEKDVAAEVDARRELAQQMVDSIFSFSEVGFQEFETQRYVTAILEKEGFTARRGVADMPTHAPTSTPFRGSRPSTSR